MSAETTLVLVLALPALGAIVIGLAGWRPNLREASTLTVAALLFWQVLRLWPVVAAGERPLAVVAALIPGAPLALRAEPLGMLFALVASGLWLVTSVYSIGYMRGHGERHQTRFYVCFAVSIAAAMGVAFSANLITLFVFYEILTLATYPLVTHAGDEAARRAGRVYLGLLLGTSFALLLPAVIATAVIAGTTEFTPGGILAGRVSPLGAAVLLAMFTLGIGKAALMPLHRWLPAAMVAPTPVSALLHAVAVVKAGVFSILKVVIYVFGPGMLTGTTAAHALAWLAAATVLIASLVAMRQDNLKLRLAYSTVSQLSYIVLGALLAERAGLIGAGMHIVMHAFAKITLFFCAGAILVASHKSEVSQLDGIGRQMPVTMTAFLVASLSIIGLPPLGGMWSKWFLALGTLEGGELGLLAVLLASSLLNMAYLLPIPLRAFFRPLPAGEDGGLREGPVTSVAALAVTALGTLLLFFNAGPFYRLMLGALGP